MPTQQERDSVSEELIQNGYTELASKFKDAQQDIDARKAPYLHISLSDIADLIEQRNFKLAATVARARLALYYSDTPAKNKENKYFNPDPQLEISLFMGYLEASQGTNHTLGIETAVQFLDSPSLKNEMNPNTKAKFAALLAQGTDTPDGWDGSKSIIADPALNNG